MQIGHFIASTVPPALLLLNPSPSPAPPSPNPSSPNPPSPSTSIRKSRTVNSRLPDTAATRSPSPKRRHSPSRNVSPFTRKRATPTVPAPADPRPHGGAGSEYPPPPRPPRASPAHPFRPSTAGSVHPMYRDSEPEKQPPSAARLHSDPPSLPASKKNLWSEGPLRRGRKMTIVHKT